VASAGLDVEHRFRHWRYDPPLKTSAFVMAVVMVLILVFVFLQYHGDFPRRARLTVMAPRAGLFLALRSPTTASRSRPGTCRSHRSSSIQRRIADTASSIPRTG